MRNAPIGLLILILFCTSAPRPASLVDVKTRAMRAGYTADLQALADAARDARALAADPAHARSRITGPATRSGSAPSTR